MSGSLSACLERLTGEGNAEMAEGSEETSSSDEGSTPDKGGESEMRRIDQLERELSVTQMQYDKHLELIALLAGTPDLDRLRQARERMQSLFPLSELQWESWLLEEIPIAQINKDAFNYVINLFDKAVQDYLSVRIWQLYCEYSVSQMHQWGDAGTEKVRGVYERAVGEVGLHLGEGDKLWGGYLEMETALFLGLQELQQGDTQEQMQEQLREKVRIQYDRVSKLYKRRLSIPLLPHKISTQQARDWDTEAVPDEATLTRVEDMYQTLLPHENSLLSTKSPTIEAFRAYMLAEQSLGIHPYRIVCLYERCLSVYPLNDSVWMEYTRYCDKQVKEIAKIESVYHRALMNVPWNKECWIGAIRVQERVGGGKDDISNLLVKTTETNFSNVSSLLDISLEYISCILRVGTPVSEVIQEVYRCEHLLEHKYGKEADPRQRLSQLRVELLVRAGEVSTARKEWEDIMLHHQDEVWYWFKYADFERNNGTKELEREVLQRGVSSSKRPRELCERWLELERMNGSLEQVMSAEEKCRARENQVAVSAESEGLYQSRNVLRAARKRVKRGDNFVSKLGLNKKAIKGDGKGRMASKKIRKVRKIAESSESESEEGEEKVISKFPVQTTDIHLTSPSKPDTIKPMDTLQTHSDTLSPQDETNTIFISNLSYGASRDKVREIFSRCGEIVSIRLETKRNNKKEFSGFGYIQFREEESVESALALDRTMMNERLLFVSRYVSKSCPVEMRPQKHDRVLDKKTLYVHRLPFDIKKERLEKLAEKYGGVKDVRVMTTRKGKPRGWAYVEFDEESSASKALLGLDELQIGDNKISVAISNPPTSKKREDWLSRREGGEKTKEGAKGPKDPIPQEQEKFKRRGPHERKLMLPRSVRISDECEMDQGEGGEGVERKGLKNDDFRKLLNK